MSGFLKPVKVWVQVLVSSVLLFPCLFLLCFDTSTKIRFYSSNWDGVTHTDTSAISSIHEVSTGKAIRIFWSISTLPPHGADRPPTPLCIRAVPSTLHALIALFLFRSWDIHDPLLLYPRLTYVKISSITSSSLCLCSSFCRRYGDAFLLTISTTLLCVVVVWMNRSVRSTDVKQTKNKMKKFVV